MTAGVPSYRPLYHIVAWLQYESRGARPRFWPSCRAICGVPSLSGEADPTTDWQQPCHGSAASPAGRGCMPPAPKLPPLIRKRHRLGTLSDVLLRFPSIPILRPQDWSWALPFSFFPFFFFFSFFSFFCSLLAISGLLSGRTDHTIRLALQQHALNRRQSQPLAVSRTSLTSGRPQT